MNAYPSSAAVVSVALPPQLGCATCTAYEASVCQAMAGAARMLSPGASAQRLPSPKVVRARRIICCGSQDLNDEVPIICEGWAASVSALSDGGRQILSILLPGDMVSTALLFGARVTLSKLSPMCATALLREPICVPGCSRIQRFSPGFRWPGLKRKLEPMSSSLTLGAERPKSA